MNAKLPAAPVRDLALALDYYARPPRLHRRLVRPRRRRHRRHLPGPLPPLPHHPTFREAHGNTGLVLTWLNLESREEVTALHDRWRANQATILSPPEPKPWGLREFTATDLDGNLLRVF